MGQTNAPLVVLVADDEPSMLELVVQHLKGSEEPRLEVHGASDGDRAWDLARELLPDLVVLDVMMPGMSGWEVCKKIRDDVALDHTSVVMLTGIGENLNQMTSPLYGADAYIDKPFDFGELDEKVKEALLARAAKREAVPRPVRNGVGGPASAAMSSEAEAEAGGRKQFKRGRSKNAVKGRVKMAAKKTAAKKTTAKKAPAKKAPAKKAAVKKMAAKKAPAKKAAKKAPAKKTAAKKAPAKKTAAKKAPAKKTAAKKAPAKKTAAKKTAKKAGKKS
jgi:DNA-binding response OmpR family regulator